MVPSSSRTGWSRLCAGGAGLAVIIASSACAPSDPTPPEPNTPRTQETATEPTATRPTAGMQSDEQPVHRDVAVVTLPSCAEANALAAAEHEVYLQQSLEGSGAPATAADDEVFTRLAGPAAQRARSESHDQRGCVWPLYIAGNSVTQYTALLPQAPREALISELRASDFFESTVDGYPVFEHSVEDPTNYRMTGPTQIQYLFVEDVWIAVFETGSSDYLTSAYESWRRLNPASHAETRASTPE